MSWISGYKSKPSTSASVSDLEESRKKKLAADRLIRTQNREARQKQLQAAIDAREAHCNTLKPQLFAAFPSLHPFFYFAPFSLQKDAI